MLCPWRSLSVSARIPGPQLLRGGTGAGGGTALPGAAWMHRLQSDCSISNPFSKFPPVTAALCWRPQAPPAHTFRLREKRKSSCSPPPALCIDKWSPWMNSDPAFVVLISSCTLSHLALKITGR